MCLTVCRIVRISQCMPSVCPTTRVLLAVGILLVVSISLVVLQVVGFAGAAVGSALEDNRGVLIGLIAFSVVAILFLVTHELLCEAFELQHGEVLWYVNVWLFLGLYAGIITEKIMNHI